MERLLIIGAVILGIIVFAGLAVVGLATWRVLKIPRRSGLNDTVSTGEQICAILIRNEKKERIQ